MDSFVNGLLSVGPTALSQLAQSPPISLALTQLLAREVVAPSAPAERQGLHLLIAALAGAPSTLSFLQLSLYAAAFQASNAQLVDETVGRALDADVLLAKQCSLLGPPQLVAALAPAQSKASIADMAQGVRVALALARSCARLRGMYGSTQAVLSALSTAYSSLLPHFAPPPAALAAAEPAALSYVALRLEVLETAHSILAAAFLDRLGSDSLSTAARSALWEDLTHTLRPTLDALPPFPKPHGVPLVDRTLLGDLHHFFRLGDTLQAAAGMATERREIADQIRRLDVREVEWDALQLLRDGPGVAVEVRTDKGKGKATVSDDTVRVFLVALRPLRALTTTTPQQTATDTSLTLAHSQILDVLPDLSPAFLTACLVHPRFGHDPEQVVAALLEDDLPPDLRALRDGHPPESALVERTWTPEPAPAPAVQVSTRSNIFDDDVRFDAGKLRRGKSCVSLSAIHTFFFPSPPLLLRLQIADLMLGMLNRTATADLLLADRSFLTDELKAAIIERAERESSDEDDEDGEDDQDLDTGAEGKGFKVRDGEDGEDDGDEVEGKREVRSLPFPFNFPFSLNSTHVPTRLASLSRPSPHLPRPHRATRSRTQSRPPSPSSSSRRTCPIRPSSTAPRPSSAPRRAPTSASAPGSPTSSSRAGARCSSRM